MRDDAMGGKLRAGLGVLALLLAAGCGDEAPTYRVAYLPAPGEGAPEARAGLELALAEVNADDAGPVGFSVTVVEDATDPASAAAACRRLLAADSVDAFVGHLTGDLLAACNEPAWRAEVPYVAAGDASSDVCAANLFQVGPLPNQAAEAAVGYFTGQGARRFFLLASDEPALRERMAWAAQLLAGSDATVVGTAQLPPGTTDFAAVAARIAEADPDVVLEALADGDRPAFYRAARGADDGSVFASLGLGEAVVAETGPAVDGVTAVADYFPAVQTPANQRFLASLAARPGESASATAGAARAYEALHLLAAAVRAAGSTEGPAVIAALGAARVDGPRGALAFPEGARFARLGMYVARASAGGDFELITFRPGVEPRASCG